MIKSIIFDLGGVFVMHKDKLFASEFTKLFSISLQEANELLDRYRESLSTGKVTTKQFLKKVKTKLSIKTPVKDLLKQWEILYINEENNIINLDLLNLLDKLKKKHKLYLFSNTIAVHDNYNRTRGIYDKFDRLFKSYLMGSKKPYIKSYLHVLKSIKAKSEECLFIDNLKENVVTAEKVGMRGIVYKNNEQLFNEFKNYNIK